VVNIFAPYHFFEGWAHYCEQMVREEGFRPDGGKTAYHEYLLGQRSDALLRLCRTYAGIRMHLGEWTPATAAEFFQEKGFMTDSAAKVEAQRGTYEPDYTSGGHKLSFSTTEARRTPRKTRKKTQCSLCLCGSLSELEKRNS